MPALAMGYVDTPSLGKRHVVHRQAIDNGRERGVGGRRYPDRLKKANAIYHGQSGLVAPIHPSACSVWSCRKSWSIYADDFKLSHMRSRLVSLNIQGYS